MPPEPPGPRPPILPSALAGLVGRCPRCGRGSMFAGPIALAAACPACGLDLGFADAGDGPAFFASFLGGFIILGVGVWLQVAYEPALWVYPLVFVPLGGIVCIALLRASKGILVRLQYATHAGQDSL